MAKNDKPAKQGQKRPLRTPIAKQARVLAKRLTGEYSEREIARSEGISRDTVSRILSQQEFQNAILEGRTQVVGLIPKAVDVYRKVLNAERHRDKVVVARHVLEGAQVMVPRSVQVRQKSFEEEAEGRTNSELVFYTKHGRWPTEEEMEHYAETGRWPHEEAKH